MTEKQDRITSLVVICIGLVLIYTSLSANCATGGSCTFASGVWFDWIVSLYFSR